MAERIDVMSPKAVLMPSLFRRKTRLSGYPRPPVRGHSHFAATSGLKRQSEIVDDGPPTRTPNSLRRP
jgi:hypothetical protein